jgi:hypothetical protein
MNDLDAAPDPSAFAALPARPGGPSLGEWMAANKVRDDDFGEKIGFDRSIVQRVRTGKLQASSKFIESAIVGTNGEVAIETFFPRAYQRVATASPPGGEASRPFSPSCPGLIAPAAAAPFRSSPAFQRPEPAPEPAT